MNRVICLCFVALVGCSIPSSGFQPSADAGGGGTDVLSIVPSATALTVDEASTAEFTVQMSQPPAAPLTVQVESLSTAIGITAPDLTFDATNYAQPRTLLVTAIPDPNIADESADIVLAAAGVSSVTIVASVADHDVVALVTSIGPSNIVAVDTGQSADVRVHLSHQPDGDVTVRALLGAGPCSVNTATRVFTPQNYDTDQVFRFTATTDPNTTSDDQALTLRIDATAPVDRQFTLREIDPDVLNFAVSPSGLTVTEQGPEEDLAVALTQQPAGNVTVTVAVIAQSGVVTVDKSQLTFTPQNFAMNQILKVRGSADADIDNDAAVVRLTANGVPARDITINIEDDDSQRILHDVGGELGVSENGEVEFGVRLAQEPSEPVVIAVQSQATGVATVMQGSVLTFTPQNYDTFQTVRVRGSDDNNLATNTAKLRLFGGGLLTEIVVNVADDDQQDLLVNASTLTIPEGMTASFNVSLRFEPLTTVTVVVASTNSTAVPAAPASLTFTAANFGTPQSVTIAPPIDTNDVSETATITVSGGGAATSKSVAVTVDDGTTIDTWGFPPNPPFSEAITLNKNIVIAFKIDVGTAANLGSFHTYVPQAPPGKFRMALYADNGNTPGALVAQMPAGKILVNNANDGLPSIDQQLTSPTYFLALRVSADANIAHAPAGTEGRRCFRNLAIDNIEDAWPSTFGGATCSPARLLQMWITTYHQ